MKSWLIVLLTFLITIALAIVGFALIGIYYEPEGGYSQIANATLTAEISVPVPSNCTGLDLILTSECLEKEIEPYFNYTIRDDLDRSLDDIKQSGGDCFDYNLLYKKWIKQLGFNAELIQFDLNNETSHVITLAYTHNAYCILDQTVHPSCVVLGEEQQ